MKAGRGSVNCDSRGITRERRLRFVFTVVCDTAAEEVCPVWPGHPMIAQGHTRSLSTALRLARRSWRFKRNCLRSDGWATRRPKARPEQPDGALVDDFLPPASGYQGTHPANPSWRHSRSRQEPTANIRWRLSQSLHPRGMTGTGGAKRTPA